MSALDTAMGLYPYLAHPAVVIGAGAIALIYLECSRQGAERSELLQRIGAFLGAGVLSLLPTLVYARATGQGLLRLTQGNAWQVDALVAGGIFVAAAVSWGVWRYAGWGPLVPGYMEALVLVTIPYIALSPFWNVSGHVMMALMPTLYVTLVDHRFWPSLAVPLVMVPNRIYLDAHTWAQAIGGLLLAAAIVAVAFWLQGEREHGAGRGSTPS